MNKAFVICGNPGSGKTTYGKSLAKKRGAAYLDIDLVTERIIKVALIESGKSPDDRDSDYFKKTYREPIYSTLLDVAKENLAWVDVVVAGPFTREVRKQGWLKELQEFFKTEVEVHYLYCSPEKRRERLARRAAPRDLQKISNWAEYLRNLCDEKPPDFPHVFVDTSELFK